jgi:hypothetical protein
LWSRKLKHFTPFAGWIKELRGRQRREPQRHQVVDAIPLHHDLSRLRNCILILLQVLSDGKQIPLHLRCLTVGNANGWDIGLYLRITRLYSASRLLSKLH